VRREIDEIGFLKFEDWQKEIRRNHLGDLWLTVYCLEDKYNWQYATFCAMLPYKPDLIEKVLENPYWEVNLDFGRPIFWRDGKGGKIHYQRYSCFASDLSFEPLVIRRSFYGIREGHVELSEEFRLYFNLYYDRNNDEFIHIDESGEEDVVAKIEKTNVDFMLKIKVKYLRDFLAAKKMVLIRFHDHVRYSKNDLTKELGSDSIIREEKGETFNYKIIINSEPISALNNWKIISRFLAKDVLLPLREPEHPDYKLLAGKTTKKYEKFIIGLDTEGNPIEHTCDPNFLNDKKYLTPVFFRSEVLRKYYNKPSKYTVGDGYLSCGRIWGMRYGLNPSGLVHAWLGDLGQYLPHSEQLHWKQFNVPPEGGLGLATIKRELLAEPAESDDLTHAFKYEFKKFSEVWKESLKWYLFLPLRKDDEHFMKSLHVPLSEDPLEFDQQIQALAKILPDSINVSEIKKRLGPALSEEEIKKHFNIQREGKISPITWLEAFIVFYFRKNKNFARKITKPLRYIQELRSASVAHRKGHKYDKTARKLGLEKSSRIKFFKKILEKVIETLHQLQNMLQINSNTSNTTKNSQQNFC